MINKNMNDLLQVSTQKPEIALKKRTKQKFDNQFAGKPSMYNPQ